MFMPKQTIRLHLSPYWYGDSPRAAVIASEKPKGADGGKFTDTNVQCTLDGEVCMHWGTARKNGYYYIVDKTKAGKDYRRKMTNSEMDRSISKWKTTEVRKWRRTAVKGESYASKVRPWEMQEYTVFANGIGVTPCYELKSTLFASQKKRALRIAQWKLSGKYKFYVMTLVTMPRWAGKMKAFHVAGIETALLAHGAKKPASFAIYKKYVTRVWGSWA